MAIAKILLVDDDPNLIELVQMRLESAGYEVRAVLKEDEAIGLVKSEQVDLCLFDLMLENQDGIALMETVHAISPDVPTIILTAHGSIENAVEAMRRGAYSYLTKPFEPRELVARIRSVLRRAGRHNGGTSDSTAQEDMLYVFEGWHLDPLKRKLTDPDGTVVSISTAEFRLLRAFLDHPRSVLDRDRLLDMVQGREAHLFDRAVDNQISRLRRKIEADSRDPQLILTVRGGGYRFAANVTRVPQRQG